MISTISSGISYLARSAFDRKIAMRVSKSGGWISAVNPHSNPSQASMDQDDPVEVLTPEELAVDLGLQVGEEYLAHIQSETQTGKEIATQLPLRLAGIWRPLNPNESYWISVQSSFFCT
jgi:hypothetical protein